MIVRHDAYELLARLTGLSIPVLTSDATEEVDFSSQRLRCKIRREDVEDATLALIFALAVLSFHDARPRGSSHIDYVEKDEWQRRSSDAGWMRQR